MRNSNRGRFNASAPSATESNERPIQGSSPEDDGDADAVRRFLEDYQTAAAAAQEQQAARLVAGGVVQAEAIQRRFAESARAARSFLLAEDVGSDQRARTQRIRAGLLFVESYRELPLLAWPRLLDDAVVEVEEQFVLWRNRHARMTERTIGRRVGTGGSSGAATVMYSTESSGNTAVSGTDYTTASGTLSWTDGDSTTKSFHVQIIDDSVAESSETVYISLGSASGASGP